MKTLTITLLVACICGALAQYDGAQPQRLQIPGAIALGPRPGNFRQGRVLQGAPSGAIRVRRPGQVRAGAFKSVPSPSPFLQQLEEPAKPVTEEPEESEILSTQQPFIASPAPFNPTLQDTQENIPQFFLNPAPAPKPIQIPNANPVSQAPPVRPVTEPIRVSQPVRIPQTYSPAPQRYEAPARQPQQPGRIAPLSSRPQRPQFRPESRPQLDDEDDYEQPIRQQVRQQPTRPPPTAQAPKYASSKREKKPVAQVIRKYRDDNPDGSITWGFENDDGSFKEETIGIDCVTRGRYGYVDPDGLKREYSYETGIQCDKAKEEQEQQGFVDYQENKAILPNGVVLDLSNMGKKSRRPQRHSQS